MLSKNAATTKTALITGITGQDGAYLAKFLLEKGYKVFGTYRRLSTPNFWRLQYLGIIDNICFIPADLIDSGSMSEAIRISNPDEIYHLAAQSFVGASFEQPIGTGDITGLGTTRVLEAIRQINRKIRFYQASTSELYGNGSNSTVTEESHFAPASPYAVAKAYAYWITTVYREAYDIFACNGILFNHESPLRGLEFVTRKITNAVAKIRMGLQDSLYLGNMDAKRDWGYAADYVESMWLMLQQDTPDDYVIATNKSHSVREFCKKAFDLAELDWSNHVKTCPGLVRPVDVEFLQGDYSKALNCLKWQPKVTFYQLIEKMLTEDLKRWGDFLAGKGFPWDAYHYPTELNIHGRSFKL